jgi:hypothetical protein
MTAIRPVDLERLEQAVLADLAAERGLVARLRQLGRLPRLALLLSLVSVEALAFWLVLPRGDLELYPPVRMAMVLGGHGGLLVVAGWLALRPLHLPGLRLAPRAVVMAGVALPVALALLPEVATLGRVETVAGHLRWGAFCFLIGATAAAAVLLLAHVLDRGGPGVALAAVAAGLTGTLLLTLHCPINYPLHLLAGHASVPIAAVVAAGLLRRRRA